MHDRGNFRRTLFLLVMVCLMVSGVCAAEVSKTTLLPGSDIAGIDKEHITGVSSAGVLRSNPYLEYAVSDTLRFTLATTGGDPSTPDDDNKMLLFGHPSPWSSITTIRVDGNNSIYGSAAGVITTAPTNGTSSSKSAWKYSDISVTQTLSFVTNPYTGRPDVMKISYLLKNTNLTKSHLVGVRVMLDTKLGDNDYAPFRVPGVGEVTTEKEFTKATRNTPQYWQAFDSLTNPLVISQGTLIGNGATEPSKSQFTNWNRVYGTLWDYAINPSSSNGDSAVSLTWNEVTLAPSQKVEYVTYYGIGSITGAGNLRVSGPAQLSVVNNAYSPNPFTIVAYLENTINTNLTDVKMVLTLPEGLSNITPLTQDIPVIEPTKTKQVSWSVKAADQAYTKTLTYRVNATARQIKAPGVNVSRSIKIPPLPVYSKTLNGGYVAKGVGMRDRGFGTIVIDTIPPNSTVQAAYLFWAVIGNDTKSSTPLPPMSSFAKGNINGNSVTGTLIGAAQKPGWGVSSGNGRIFGYRATVTTVVQGNGNYSLTGFASGRTDGADPWNNPAVKYPLMEGASLVVVYSNALYPSTRVTILNGVDTYNRTTGKITFTGLPASSLPVAYTTWIVADGQSNLGKTVTFNGVTMPTSYLKGNDPQAGAKFQYGNLSDTQTALVRVTPGATSVNTTIQSTGDPLTWIAQVLSVSDGNQDTDGDALKDSWEVYGYDYNNDGRADVDLPKFHASPYHKDLFVWINWMTGHKPNASVLTRSVATFKNAPFANNPDGKPGITLHNNLSGVVDEIVDLNPPFGPQFNTTRDASFPRSQRAVYHYCLFAHGILGDTTSGMGWMPGDAFIVSLGAWPNINTLGDVQTGTYLHELGHNLGLNDGGADGILYKPNYLSIMNYHFQFWGVIHNGRWGNYDYQRIDMPSLNERSLLEADGIGAAAAGYGTVYYCPGLPGHRATRVVLVNKPINWTCNETIDAFRVRVDLNNDMFNTTLISQNDWKQIVYNGGVIGKGAGSMPTAAVVTADQMHELTYEDYLLQKATRMKISAE